MIIGIAGTLGAGKGTVVDYLVKEKGFVHYSSSDLLTEMLKERGEVVNRDEMARTAREIRAKDPNGVPKLTYERLKKENPKNAILESLHTIGEAKFVKGVGGIILGVDADVDVRYKRIKRRNSVKDYINYKKFLEQVKREEDAGSDASGHNIRGVIDSADYVIQNNGTINDLHHQIDNFLKQSEESYR